MKSYLAPDDIVFWKWTAVNNIGMVTETAVYHWSIDGDSAPVKVFDRHASLAGCQIISMCFASTFIGANDRHIDLNMNLFGATTTLSSEAKLGWQS